jgi:hypothetical protein
VEITNGQSRETGNIGYTRRRQTKQKHNTICVGHRYAQTNTNNLIKTSSLLQKTGGKDEPNIYCSVSFMIGMGLYVFFDFCLYVMHLFLTFLKESYNLLIFNIFTSCRSSYLPLVNMFIDLSVKYI